MFLKFVNVEDRGAIEVTNVDDDDDDDGGGGGGGMNCCDDVDDTNDVDELLADVDELLVATSRCRRAAIVDAADSTSPCCCSLTRRFHKINILLLFLHSIIRR